MNISKAGASDNKVSSLKVRIIVILLLVSIAGNITLLITSIHSFNKISRLKKHKSRLENQALQIQANFSNNELSTRLEERLPVYRRDYVSHEDGKEGSYGLAPPMKLPGEERLGLTLLVYFHGFGSSYLEPFLETESKSISSLVHRIDPGCVVLSVNCKLKSPWLSNPIFSDVNQNIDEIVKAYPISRIVLCGSSLGACLASSYCYLAPPRIGRKFVGLLAVEGSGDLAELYRTTASDHVRAALLTYTGGAPEAIPELYEKLSLNKNISMVPKEMRIAVVSALKDRMTPAPLQERMEHLLSECGFMSRLYQVDQTHGLPDKKTLFDSLEFVLDSHCQSRQ